MYKIIKSKVYLCSCERCKYEWKSFNLPISCAKCKSRSWNIKPKKKIIEV